MLILVSRLASRRHLAFDRGCRGDRLLWSLRGRRAETDANQNGGTRLNNHAHRPLQIADQDEQSRANTALRPSRGLSRCSCSCGLSDLYYSRSESID
jgi:hypothetical protein